MSLLKFLCFLICVVAVCAKPHLQSRVIGGSTVVSPNPYSYVVSLRQKQRFPLIPVSGGIPISNPLLTYPDPKPHFCTGSIIASNWVLTANHCFCTSIVYAVLNSLPVNVDVLNSVVCTLQASGAYVVQVDTLNLNTINSTNEYAVAESIPHPNYKSKTIENDIGLIRLAKNILYAQSIAIAIALPADNIAATIIGWGLTDYESSTLPNTLQAGAMSILSLVDCQAALANSGGSVTAANVCGFGGGSVSACNGDSGGPLEVSESGSRYIVGVTSWGIRGCDPFNPSVFTNVYHFSAYIKTTTGIN